MREIEGNSAALADEARKAAAGDDLNAAALAIGRLAIVDGTRKLAVRFLKNGTSA